MLEDIHKCRANNSSNDDTVFAQKIRHSYIRQGKIFVQVYSNPDEFPVSLISAI